MKHNVGGMDRTSRIVIGILLLLVAFFGPIGMAWRIVALIVAAIALITAGVRYCPLNAAFGIDTSESKPEAKK